MLMKKSKKAVIIIFIAIIILSTFMSIGISVNAATNLSLTVSYNAKCGEPTTFTVNASGGTGNYMYYLGNITREGEDGQYFVVDPSRLPGYQASNTFQFTFCASGVYYLHFYVMDKGTSPIVTKRTIIKVNINDSNYPSIEKIADNVAAQCMSSCRTEYERALWLHDWLVDNCSYDYSFLYCGSEGALARGKGTCESYHRAYTMLLNRVGIANGRMEGNGHVWTAVRIDGKWCQVDVTWDDNGYSYRTYENYIYFGLNDALMKVVHSDHSPHTGYESNFLVNSCLIKSGSINQWSDPLRNQLQQKLEEGKTSFIIPINSGLPDTYKTVIYSLVAYQFSTQSWSTAKNRVQVNASYLSGQINVSAVYMSVSTQTTETKTTKTTETVTSKTGNSYEETTTKRAENRTTGSKAPESGNNYEKATTKRTENGTTDSKNSENGSFNEEITTNSKEHGTTDSEIPENGNSHEVATSSQAESEITFLEASETKGLYPETLTSDKENTTVDIEADQGSGNIENSNNAVVYIGVGISVMCVTLSYIFIIRKRKL